MSRDSADEPFSQDDFTPDDVRQMEELGISADEAHRQIALFENPPPPVRLARPARVGDGIEQIESGEKLRLEVAWANLSSSGRVTKFVPASGAASRMFRQLEALLHGETHSRAELEKLASGGDADAEKALVFLDDLEKFAFFEDLRDALSAAGHDLGKLRRAGAIRPILLHLLTDAGGHGLGYASASKGLVRFHRYPGGERRTAFDEHLVEAVGMVRDEDGTCRLHFTVTPDHQPDFEERLEEMRATFEERYECSFEVGFSHQSHSTDTLAVDLENRPFRTDEGRLLFRPGGHGALLDNLNALDADAVVIKNVDNVLPEKHQEAVLLWKRLLLGKLQQLKDHTYELLTRLESTGGDDEDLLAEAEATTATLGHPLPARLVDASAASRRAWFIDRFDRPLRVCGVVENQGEPGGGPFWVQGDDGTLSLQIVEKSQIDLDDPQQAEILAATTHFNPVDVVCSLTDTFGRRYDLADYVDESAVFIARKFHQGRELQALERPGLWNGAMAGWNTVFVEVPVKTFAPVKTVFDLLRDAHQTGVPPAPVEE